MRCARVALLLVVLGSVLGALVAGGGANAASSSSPVAPWGSLQVLTPAPQYAFDPQLVVAADGRTLAGWFGGPPPPARTSSGALAGPPTAPWTGSDVVVDAGTVDGGFGTPQVLSTHGSDRPEGLQVALSGTGVSYAAWEQKSGGWMISGARAGGSFTTTRALPASRSRLWGLVRSPAGPVAAVWFGSSSSGPAPLRYALLRPDGTLGRVVTVGAWNGPVEGTSFALNDRGEFAAVDMVGGDGEGTVSPAPRVRICDADGRCSRPRELRFGRIPAGAEENNAIALSDDGTVTVLASFSKVPKHPAPNTPLGLWDAVRRPGGRWSSPQELSRAGERPIAAADGRHSAMVLIQHFWEPDRGGLRFLGNRLETSTLPDAGLVMTRPIVLRGLESPEREALATSPTGRFLVAGIHNPSPSEDSEQTSILAITGSSHPGPVQLVYSGEVAGEPRVGIDGSGGAVILWVEDSSSSTTQGVFASIHHAG